MNIFRHTDNKNNVIHTLKTVSVTIGLEMCLCGDEKWNRFVKIDQNCTDILNSKIVFDRLRANVKGEKSGGKRKKRFGWF